MDKIIDAGVTVFKIEGRARGPEYVKTVIECYKEAVELWLEGTGQWAISDEEIEELKSYFLLIKDNVEKDDYFRIDITKRLLAAYLYKLGSVLYRHRPELQEEAAKPLKREEILFKEFIRLVSEHHRKERRVDFYAERMFLSSKHFSTVIKKVSGKTAGQWIDEYVILEAKTLLKYSAMSIQEVAYYMNFPNPSFFGKYFKQHTGMSPSDYKTQI